MVAVGDGVEEREIVGDELLLADHDPPPEGGRGLVTQVVAGELMVERHVAVNQRHRYSFAHSSVQTMSRPCSA